MKKTIINITLMLITAIFTVTASACSSKEEKFTQETHVEETVEEIPEETVHEEIAILFTGNLFGKIKSESDLKKIADRAQELKKDNIMVDVVDLGSFVGSDGSIDDAQAAMRAMKACGYSHAVVNRNEFCFGIDGLRKLIEAEGPALISSNFRYSGFEEDITEKILKYDITELGSTKVGYVAISDPQVLDEDKDIFIEDGRVAYSFCGRSTSFLSDKVQESIDKCRQEGADYVIVLSGVNAGSTLTALDLVQMTSGADAFLCAFDQESESNEIKAFNEENKEIPVALTKNDVDSFGELKISSRGVISFVAR
ncbi:MAG: hypothetical protein K6F93_07770 [Lachnospiraceae bacterium]|nr:hypothetical protein [Lachnospiraceae bacterium]